MNEYYYEIGVMPTMYAEDGYSLYVKTKEKLIGNELEKLQYLVDNGFILGSEAKHCIYIISSTKEDYEWSIRTDIKNE